MSLCNFKYYTCNNLKECIANMMRCVEPVIIAAMLLLVMVPVCAKKLDYSSYKIVVEDPDWGGNWVWGTPACLADGYGAEPYPVAPGGWARDDAPREGKPAAVIFNYGKPVKATALAHYFYVPGCRDQKWGDWLSGPSAFKEIRIYASDDKADWKEVSHLNNLPAGCPQLLAIENPVSAQYLKIEVLSLADGAGRLRSYEIDTYVDEVPKSLPTGDKGKAQRRGFPNKAALEPAKAGEIIRINDGKLDFGLHTAKGRVDITLDVKVSDQAVLWDKEPKQTSGITGTAAGHKIEMEADFVKAGLLLKFKWHGPVTYPMAKLDVIARPKITPNEWCVPEYYYSNKEAPTNRGYSSASVQTCISIISDGKQCLTFIPDTDQSWVGVIADGIYTTFPINGETQSALLAASDGDWFSGFEKAVADVFDFNEPRQFAPVTSTVETLYAYLMQPSLWSEEYQMLRSFPDTDFFYIFYSLPYAIPAMINWEALSGDSVVGDKIDKILRFTLDRRIREGTMKGAIFSQYADKELVEKSQVPFGYAPYYAWHKDYPDEKLVGMDQAGNRWITAHCMGSVLWAVCYVWECRGELPKDIIEASRDVADWMVRYMKEDGSWSYGYKEDGSIASPMSDSGTIWNTWSLYKFAKLTGEKKYSDAAEKSADYFRNTFVKNHLYRGYWEDNYGNGATVLNDAQGYESSIAALAFADMGDNKSANSTAKDGLRFVCTRTLESRDYWTSYGGASEQQAWAPGSYIAPTFGRAAQVAWLDGGGEFLGRFSGLAKTIGWWIDATGTSFWIGEAVGQQPIEMYRKQGGQRSYWALWDCAQKANFAIQWLVDDVKRRSGGKLDIDPENLRGTDDDGNTAHVRLFDGIINSTSGQVNWLWLHTTDDKNISGRKLVLINHAEATEVSVRPSMRRMPDAARLYDGKGKASGIRTSGTAQEIKINLPEQSIAVLSWD